MIGGNLFYFFIRRENGFNDRLKLVKNGRKETEIERNKNESQETRNELKVSDLETYPLKNEERWIAEENLHGFAYGNILEVLRKHLGLDFLHGNNLFHPKQLKYITREIQDP